MCAASAASGPGAEPKEILQRVNGSVEAGQMLAIMGASGAGKTTLLQTLSGRLNRAHFRSTGSVKLFRKKCFGLDDSNLELQTSDVGYVYQVNEEISWPILLILFYHFWYRSYISITFMSINLSVTLSI